MAKTSGLGCSFYVYLMFTILSPNVISLRFLGMLMWMMFLLCGPPILGKVTTLYPNHPLFGFC